MVDLAKLKSAFKKDGSSTAGNSSQVSDGAGAVLLMKRSLAKKKGPPTLSVLGVFSLKVIILLLTTSFIRSLFYLHLVLGLSGEITEPSLMALSRKVNQAREDDRFSASKCLGVA
ncbi:hypothetical protein SOVF_125110 [Spinacia oleracea]|nr:hypothetical protein SOVF_125110 [Spinacia oleracea]